MAGLAVLLKNRGWEVSGCDLRPTPRTDWLVGEGIAFVSGHAPAHVAAVDTAALAAVDAREAAGEEEKAAAAAMVGANAVTGTGRPAILSTECPQRELPKFEHALDEKTPPPDESDVYSKPVEQKEKLEEWKVAK